MRGGRFHFAAFLLIATSACASRSCSGVSFTKEQEVANLAKRRGFELTVRACTDASRGGWTIEGTFSCLFTADAAKKQQIIDGFGLSREARRWPNKLPATPTDTFTCGTRLDVETNERARWGQAEGWYADGHAASIPG